MAQTPWLLIALGGFVLLLLILFLVSKLFPNEFAEYDELHGGSRTVPPTPPRSTAINGAARLVHMGAPSPGARTPPWLAKARQEAKAKAERTAQPATVPRPRMEPAPVENWLRQRVGVQSPRPLPARVRAIARAAERKRMLAIERGELSEEEIFTDDGYPYDADWDDHDVDWGETR